jgi:uncharacterized membrane protein YeaQ/YmgE (transglycosylase-associated protein family)
MTEPKSPEHRTSPAGREASAPLPPERSGRRPLIRVDVDREALAAFDKRAIAAQLGVGIVAGWLASWVVGGSGLLRYALTGVVGSFVGAFLLEKLGVDLGLKSPLANRIATATIGAAVVVVVARLLS